MKKQKLLSLVTVATISLTNVGVMADSVDDTVSATSDSTMLVTPNNPTPSAPTPSTDPITDTTEPSAPTPSTDQTTDATDSSTSAPSTEAEKPTPSKEPDAPKPITKPIVDVPISTVTGDTVIGTENGKVIVQSASGTILKDAKEVGGEVQKDGTVAIKKSDGKIEVLPKTGEGKTIFTIVGLLLIAGAVWIGFKDNIKKYLTFFKNKSEK
ncbi:TPA: LPXTG cell wall anchor domain-containing protein [Streptococcus agalactiae]|uniref:LPXTG cell wall anchor domain-containing protein n=2 Tax=Streptococcus agalactiae TaxID=1311 RepID=UPI0005E4268F|nr:LPXTG cell wall anchor domain-containing protein [Streptococcus agalactiae]CNE99479.1 cell wall surface anchor family protein [Streptococcus agalactiae]HEN4360944.1 LPXTG cell wall anchor domain-containing protein [Streptococcus agalactiae]